MSNKINKIINLTPHEIKIVGEDGEAIATFPPSGKVARVQQESVEIPEMTKKLGGIKVVKTEYKEIDNLPPKEEGKIYIVSVVVLQALKQRGIERNDVVAPDTGPESVVRDFQGNIIGVKRFMVL